MYRTTLQFADDTTLVAKELYLQAVQNQTERYIETRWEKNQAILFGGKKPKYRSLSFLDISVTKRTMLQI